jgi:hypothetical protein
MLCLGPEKVTWRFPLGFADRSQIGEISGILCSLTNAAYMPDAACQSQDILVIPEVGSAPGFDTT